MKNILLFVSILTLSFFASSQIENGMVAHFPFNNNLDDISTSQISSIGNNILYTNDRNGAATYGLSLSGINNGVNFSDNSVKVSFPITISVWVKFNSFLDANVLFTSDNEFANYYGYWLGCSPTGKMGISFSAGNGGANASNRRSFVANMQIQTNQWYHVLAIIHSANDMELYIDCNKMQGTYSGTGGTTISYSSSGSSIGSHIGNNSAPNGIFFDGDLDQLIIWDRLLTQNEMNLVCNSSNTLLVHENDLNNNFSVYPNPFLDEITLVVTDEMVGGTYNIYSQDGKIVLSGRIENLQQEVNTSGMFKGFYFVEITKGSQRIILKTVK